MAQLTQEYFDKKLSGLATKTDLEKLAVSTREGLAKMATKTDLDKLAVSTKTDLDKLAVSTQEGFAKMATKAHLERVELSFDQKLRDQSEQIKEYTKAQLKEMEDRLNLKLDAMFQLLDVRERVQVLERQVKQLMAK